jgi:phosphoribosylformimino-5-aminoimidazole carboxamide ribotide isomerase
LEKSASGIEGVIAGRALYDGRLDLAEALALARSGKV